MPSKRSRCKSAWSKNCHSFDCQINAGLSLRPFVGPKAGRLPGWLHSDNIPFQDSAPLRRRAAPCATTRPRDALTSTAQARQSFRAQRAQATRCEKAWNCGMRMPRRRHHLQSLAGLMANNFARTMPKSQHSERRSARLQREGRMTDRCSS